MAARLMRAETRPTCQALRDGCPLGTHENGWVRTSRTTYHVYTVPITDQTNMEMFCGEPATAYFLVGNKPIKQWLCAHHYIRFEEETSGPGCVDCLAGKGVVIEGIITEELERWYRLRDPRPDPGEYRFDFD